MGGRRGPGGGGEEIHPCRTMSQPPCVTSARYLYLCILLSVEYTAKAFPELPLAGRGAGGYEAWLLLPPSIQPPPPPSAGGSGAAPAPPPPSSPLLLRLDLDASVGQQKALLDALLLAEAAAAAAARAAKAAGGEVVLMRRGGSSTVAQPAVHVFLEVPRVRLLPSRLHNALPPPGKDVRAPSAFSECECSKC